MTGRAHRPAGRSSVDGQVSPTARFIAKLLRTLEPPELAHLFLAFGGDTQFPDPSLKRRHRLKLLLDFYAVHDRIPTASEYRERAAARRGAGEQVASIGELERWYGSYSAAQVKAARLFLRGTAARESFRPDAMCGRRQRGSVTDSVVLDCIDLVTAAIEHPPSEPEYRALAEADELLAAAHSLKNTRLVHIKQIETLFGRFGDAVLAAERRRLDRQAAHVDSGRSDRRRRGSPKGQTKRRRPRSARVRAVARA